ncbi:MAG TPA: transglycosylase domain-containing protein, partial [Alphaproteobacteria bacterium]|nr:transglycosylase domain-containing protein [Alphaproteobacteria bacterium]
MTGGAPLAWLWRRPALCLTALLVTVGGIAAATRPPALPDYEQVRRDWRASEAWLRGRDGRLLQTVRIDFAVRRLEWVPLERVSPSLREAVVASEDRHFAGHGGIDWSAFLGSAWAALNGRPARGASTISMQLAAFLEPGLGGP